MIKLAKTKSFLAPIIIPVLIPAIIPSIITAAAVITIVTNKHYHSTQEKRSRKYEQVRISREIWVEILKQNRLIHEWPLVDKPDYKMLKRYMDSLKNDLDYFVFFVKKGEINAPDILEYSKRVGDVDADIKLISKGVTGVDGWDETKMVRALISEYKEFTKNLSSN